MEFKWNTMHSIFAGKMDLNAEIKNAGIVS